MLVPVTEADGFILDIRYATADNLTGRTIYKRPVALLRPEARTKLLDAALIAAALGLRLKILDAFRPIEAQWLLWHAVTDKQFVADPSEGGMHPRGVAVDLTLVDAVSGRGCPMGTGFDEVSPLSAHGALGIQAEAIRNRALLLGIMTSAGWEHYGPEWWHYHLPGHAHLPVLAAKDVVDGPM
jgi:D-alanyl-D-alanine dipeptidase